MPSRLNPYLSFRSNAREAMEFYKSVFGGNLSLMTFGDGGMARDPAENNFIMHCQLETPDGYTIMGSDTPSSMEFRPAGGMTVSISGDDNDKLRGYWHSLSPGATIAQPLEKAPWGDSFGMLVDRFGTPWMFNLADGQQE